LNPVYPKFHFALTFWPLPVETHSLTKCRPTGLK
jgi:hypothetical protein